MKKIILAMTLCAALAGCFKPEPLFPGRVTEKVYEPASTWVQMLPIFTGKTTIFIPYVHHDDEDFVLNVLGQRPDGSMKMQRIYVTRADWERFKVGDRFGMSRPRAVAEDRHRKVRKS